MSKSTQRYGKITFTAKTSIDANPALPVKVSKQWDRLTKMANALFGKPYFSLSSGAKTRLHETINGVPDWSADRLKLTEAGLL